MCKIIRKGRLYRRELLESDRGPYNFQKAFLLQLVSKISELLRFDKSIYFLPTELSKFVRIVGFEKKENIFWFCTRK